MSRLTWMVAAVALCLGCAEDIVRPEPPDLSGLVQQYQQPSGTVTAQTARQVIDQAATELGLVDNIDGLIDLVEAIIAGPGAAAQSSEDGLMVERNGLTVGQTDVSADGWLVYHRICPTASGTGVRGRLRMTMLANLEGIEPVVWGRADDCRFDGSTIDGGIALHLDFVEGGIGGVIVRIDGRVKLGDTLLDGRFTVAWSEAAVVTHVDLQALGGFLVGVDPATNQLLIQGINGRFRCDAGGCESPEERFEW